MSKRWIAGVDEVAWKVATGAVNEVVIGCGDAALGYSADLYLPANDHPGNIVWPVRGCKAQVSKHGRLDPVVGVNLVISLLACKAHTVEYWIEDRLVGCYTMADYMDLLGQREQLEAA